MKKYFLLIVAIFLCTITCFAQFHIIHIPDDRVMAIKMDGNIEDWSWVQQKDYITIKSLNELAKGSIIDRKDWDCKFIVGWNGITNRIYVMAMVYDDKRNTEYIPSQDQFWLNDAIEVILYPMIRPSAESLYRFHFLVPTRDRSKEITIDAGAPWIKSYIDHGWKMPGDTKKPGWTFYEFSMPVWDNWSIKGAQFSNRHNIGPGETVCLGIAFDDRDDNIDNVRQWNTCYGNLWYADPVNLSRFILDFSTFNSKVSWDNINKVLKP